MLGNFNNQELANTAWACGTLDCLQVPLMQGIAVAAIKQKNVKHVKQKLQKVKISQQSPIFG